MPQYRGIPLSDDEYGERLKEAETRATLAYCGWAGSRVALWRAFDATLQAFAALDQQMDQLRRDFEAPLSADEFLRYTALLEEHPDWGWLDAACEIKPEPEPTLVRSPARSPDTSTGGRLTA